ncbi:MAG: hypothetical protein V3R94_07915 [Acidobacteriota bacterium]
MNGMRFFRLLASMALLVATVWATGTSIRLVNLPDMVRLADRVFLGVCLSVEAKPGASVSSSMVEYVFAVRQGIKGVNTGERVVFRQVGSGQVGVKGIAGLPTYGKGEEVLLFLHADSRLGLTSPVGLAQGVFRLEDMGDGKRGVLNGLHNRNLTYRMGPNSVPGGGISNEELRSLQEVRPVPIETFMSLVRRIDLFHDSKGRAPQ